MALTKTKVAQIRGITHMNHRIRTLLDISCAEYCILDFVYQLNLKAKHFSIESGKEDMFKFLGLYPETLSKVIEGLIVKEFLACDSKGNHLMTTAKWDNHFGNQFVVEYNTLWLKHNVGNKKMGLDMYTRARMEGISFEHLSNRLDIYLAYIDKNGKFPQHMSTFMNPKFKQFDNECFDEEVETKNQQLNFSL